MSRKGHSLVSSSASACAQKPRIPGTRLVGVRRASMSRFAIRRVREVSLFAKEKTS
jgi:hypothetical protein